MSTQDNKQAMPVRPQPERAPQGARPSDEEIRRQLGWGLVGPAPRQPAA